MMKGYILLIIFLSLCLVGVQLRSLQDEEPTDVPCNGDYRWTMMDNCFSGGGGYGRWHCELIDYKKDIYKWIKWKTVKCPKEKPGCQCHEYGDWDDVACECYNPTLPPSFPPTGIIRWNGKEIYDSDYYIFHEKPRSAQIFGEVHKNANGYFLLNRTVLGQWDYSDHKQIPNAKILFEIYVPDGFRFIKYSGEYGNKICTMSRVTQGRELSSIWDTGRHYLSYRLKESKLKEGSIYTQKWERFEQQEDHDTRWTMDVEYDEEKKYAIPIKYKYRQHDGLGGTLSVNMKKYTFEPINEGEQSFQVGDFCDNI